MSLKEIEAFKTSTRKETTIIVEFMVENLRKDMNSRFEQIETSCKELGESCKEIIPRLLFDVSYIYVSLRGACLDSKTLLFSV